MITKITKRDVIKGVLPSFRSTYSRGGGVWSKRGRNAGQMIAALEALDLETCSEADVYDAIETNWTRNACDECDTDSEVLVRIGDEPDYDMRWVDICPSCLAKATEALS